MRTQHTHTMHWLKRITQHLATMFVLQPVSRAEPCPTSEQITALRAAIYGSADDSTPVHARANASMRLQQGYRHAVA